MNSPQPIHHATNEPTNLCNFHAANSVHLHTRSRAKHFEAFAQLAHAHFLQIAKQSSDDIRVVEIIGGVRE